MAACLPRAQAGSGLLLSQVHANSPCVSMYYVFKMYGKLILFQPPFLILILSLSSSFRHHSPGSHCGCLECFQGRVQVGHRPEVVKLATQLNTIGA